MSEKIATANMNDIEFAKYKKQVEDRIVKLLSRCKNIDEEDKEKENEESTGSGN